MSRHPISNLTVEEVRKRANVPRVRSSEVRRILEAYADVIVERYDPLPAEA